MEDEIRRLRRALSRRVSGRGRRFAPELRHAISSVGQRMRGGGATWREIGEVMGLSTGTVRRLCDGNAGLGGSRSSRPLQTRTGVVIVTPSGFRIEGLDATAAATLIRQLA
jgi:hypothetical protein